MTSRVTVFALGGTIAMTKVKSGGAGLTLSGRDLLESVPGLAEADVALDVVDFRRVPGASVDIGDVVALSAAIESAFADGVDGVVVTQGTDTIEETSYLLDLWHGSEQPIVVTGAMRNPALAGHDGPANLLAAILTAADPGSAGRGVLVAFADAIHAASRVRKTHATSIATFQSPDTGPLGHVMEGQVRFHHGLPARVSLRRPAQGLPRIGIHSVSLGDHGDLLEGVEAKVDGLILAAMGAGHVPEQMVPVLEKLAAVMPVVLASRTGAGAVLRYTYGFDGSERHLIRCGLIPAGFLNPFKARLLLGAALAAGVDRPVIAEIFAVAGGYPA